MHTGRPDRGPTEIVERGSLECYETWLPVVVERSSILGAVVVYQQRVDAGLSQSLERRGGAVGGAVELPAFLVEQLQRSDRVLGDGRAHPTSNLVLP